MLKQVKVVTLNIQHGWNTDGAMPLIFRRRELLQNLDKIAALLSEHGSDIVLLQEVDRNSLLTRKIDQLAYIAEKAGYPHHAHGTTSELRFGGRMLYSAGCGIISRFPITATENIKFDVSLPSPRKGFLVATLRLPEEKTLTVVSAHFPVFDLMNIRSRRLYIDRMAETLRDRGPIIIGGDLNMSLSVLNRENFRILSSRLNVQTHANAEGAAMATYPAWEPRRKIDWIFASPELELSEYVVLSKRVSDHLAIGTTVSI